MVTPTEENYLKALLALADEDGRVGISKLAESMGISAPTVNSMVRKLHQRGLIAYRRYRPLELTAAGRTAAALVVRKHRLTEMFLVERMGFGWEEVHPIAEQIEHINSPDFFARMDQLLGHPTVDPHGSPIPSPTGEITEQPYRPLTEVEVGTTVRLRALGQSSSNLLRLLNQRGIFLNMSIAVHYHEPFDGSLTVSYPGYSRTTLSQLVASKLLVE